MLCSWFGLQRGLMWQRKERHSDARNARNECGRAFGFGKYLFAFIDVKSLGMLFNGGSLTLYQSFYP